MRRFIRMCRLGLHFAAGVLTILFVFPRLNERERALRVVRWAKGMMDIFRVRLIVHGPLPDPSQGGLLLVANHVSWLDIYVLHSLLYTRFISKAEVRGWPLIGWLAEMTGTLFLERTRKSDAARINREMAEHLRSGDCLALFPEGTTSDGTGLLPFYPSLFNPAVEARARVQPTLIRYLDPQGGPCQAAAYYGDMSLGQSALNILRTPGIVAEVTFLPTIEPAALHRRELAQAAETAMREALASVSAPVGRGTPLGTDARPPAGRP